ncbi:hypothetical protein Neosp_012417 [[Neocosmospora] mangrovei]
MGDKHLFKALDQVQKTLSTSRGQSYLEAFQCTFHDLLRRHELQPRTATSSEPSPFGKGEETSKPSAPISPPNGPTIEVTGEPQAGMRRAWSSKSDLEKTESKQTPDNQTAKRCQELKKKIVEGSQKILASFLPDGSRSVDHPVLMRFWGSVDAICRQISWAYASIPRESYMIRDFDALSSLSEKAMALGPTQETWADCLSCRSGMVYGTAAEALQHLHSHHSRRVTCGNEGARPFDDPSFVWLHPTIHGGQDVTSINHMEEGVNKLLQDLLDLNTTVEELHLLAARAFKTDKMEQTPPHSPKLRALFGELVSLYILRGSHLSLLNRLSLATTGKDTIRQSDLITEKITDVERRASWASRNAKSLAEDIKSDIIVRTNTASTAGGLGAEAVGAEFLVLALILNLQNRPLKIAKNMKDDKVKRHEEDTEVARTYQDYVAKLHIQANRRPQKRLFLDISAVQEELDALLVMGNCQWVVVNNFMRLIWPWSFHIPEPTRMDLHLIEDRYARTHMNKRAIVDFDLLTLREKTTALKENVKQTVEVLEENHGKAIRVFTIVTLFFLPLSFVSSFMGMNTMDIRDMEHNQTIYWAAAVPVTAGTMALALITCRKVSGGTNTTNFIVPEEKFTLNSGQPKSFSTEHETGMIIKLFFCSDCGTTMWKEASAPQFKGVKIVQAGTLTDPTNFTGNIDVELYAPERASWLVALQGVEQKEQL